MAFTLRLIPPGISPSTTGGAYLKNLENTVASGKAIPTPIQFLGQSWNF
jgi:hypothetical protein